MPTNIGPFSVADAPATSNQVAQDHAPVDHDDLHTKIIQDLNDGLKALQDFGHAELVKLNDFANAHPELPIGGFIRQDLNALANSVGEATEAAPEATSTSLDAARKAASQRS